MTTRQARLPRRDWASWVWLALPFLVGVAALRGLTVALPMFHGSDELLYHYPTILRFGHELPFPDLNDYHAAQTPLFHLLMAYAGKVIGYQLWRLRLVEVLISYMLALAVFRLLRNRLGMNRLPALALTLVFVLSPYVYAASFRLMTDNLALLFSVLAIDRFERFREDRAPAAFLAGCAAAGAALLTRQSAAFLVAVGGLYALRAASISARARLLALGGICLAAVPAGLLFLSWHGLTPPSGDPGSCGLCSGGTGATGLRMSAAELALAACGLYGAVLFAPGLVLGERSGLRRLLPGAALAAAIGALMLLVFPAAPNRQHGEVATAGLLWNAASHTPTLAGTSLLFWVLVPLAGAVLWWRFTVAPRRWLFVAVLGCFLLGTLVVRLSWQKYVDPYVLLALMISAGPDELDSPGRLSGAALLAAGSIAYALSFV